MPTIKSTDETFDTLVKENKIIIFDFWATWCAPCTNIAPYLEDISNDYPDWKVCKHNIDEEPNKPAVMGVRGIPTMILFVNGEQKNVKIGATTKSDIISWIKSNI